MNDSDGGGSRCHASHALTAGEADDPGQQAASPAAECKEPRRALLA